MTTYRRLKLDALELGKKYKFYKTNGREFIGNFYGLTNTTIFIKNYESINSKDSPVIIRSMPRDWINYAESEEFKIKINNFID